jgi:hypothetical protein
MAAALSAWGQRAIENWAVPAGMGASQTVSVLATLNQPVLNRPFSATATVRTTHTLEDGIHINQTTTALMYRDAQGRQRNESNGAIDIVDPVAQVGISWDSANQIAIKRSVGSYVVPVEKFPVQAFPENSTEKKAGKTGKKRGGAGAPRNILTENLGLQTVNGLLCYGGRETITIPVGAIGNDREIKSVKETWTSSDLHILVKSIDSDPRFGTSTYELTNIVQAAPNAALFKVEAPPGYTVRMQQGILGWEPVKEN